MAKKIRYIWGIRIILIMLAIYLASYVVSCGGGGGGGVTPPNGDGEEPITVTAKLFLPDGTEKEFTDTPLPRNLIIQLTFSGPVDTELAESLLSLKAGDQEIPTVVSWDETNTIATIKARDFLDYQTTYTISVSSGIVTAAAAGKADVEPLESTFSTMVRRDMNGDGKAELVVSATDWEAGAGDGRVYIFYGGSISSGSASGAGATIDSEQAGDRLSVPGTATPDLNDDGFADTILASPIYGGSQGRYYFFYGGSGTASITGSNNAADADFIISGQQAGDEMGLLSIADVNGDGYSDILTGTAVCDPDKKGCIYIFLGPNFGTKTADQADIIITGENADDMIGGNALCADMNGDGVADIIAEATGYASNAGRIYVFYGGSGLASMDASQADIAIDGENAGDTLTVQALGDLDADGALDIVVRAQDNNPYKSRLYIFYSANLASESASQADVIYTAEELGQSLRCADSLIGDVNGDDINDLVFFTTQYGSSAGRIYGFLSNSGFTSKGAGEADFIFTGENAGDLLEALVLGDFNGDGIDDILAGATFYLGGNRQGRAYVFFGSDSLASKGAGEADVILTGENANDRFINYGCASDFNGDSVMDLFASSWIFNAFAGRGYVFYGGSGLATESAADADVIIDGENGSDVFGQCNF